MWLGFNYRKLLSQSIVVRDYLVYFAVRLTIAIIQSQPDYRCARYCELIGNFASKWLKIRFDLVRENLKRVFPQWSESEADLVVDRMWEHLLLMICEIAHAPRKIHRTNWYDYFFIRDRKMALNFLLDSRPKIVVTGHFGNFELAGFVTGLFGMPSSTIARKLDNPFLHRFISEFRSTGGQHLIDKDGSASNIQRLLESGGTLALLADQDAGNKGCWVQFLGSPASCHKALAIFTLSNQAPMMVCYNRRRKRAFQYCLEITGIAEPQSNAPYLESVQTLTQWYNDRLERGIRTFPDQYWWLHRRWRQPPPRLRRHSRAAKAVGESRPAA